MVNKILIGVGIAALVAVGSVGAWKLSGAERSVGALGPLEKPVPLAWRGTWTRDTAYQPGQVVSYGNSSYVAESATAGETPNPKEGPWALMAAQGAAGAQGPAGTFSGTLQSPDGKYTLSVTNAGIVATGPNGQFTLDNGGVVLKSGTTLVLDAGTNLDLKAANLDLKATASATIRGSITHIGCTGGVPAARVGSQVQVNGNVAVGADGGSFPVISTGAVLQGSPTILIC
jgi:hypothetical protein